MMVLETMTGAINLDDEGVEGQRTVLVEDGILRTYMHDRISHDLLWGKANKNGRRESFKHTPVPRGTRPYMCAGKI